MKRIFCLLIAWVTLGLGILGVFLPLLPTTPFLLLSSYFFARSSPKMRAWLLNHRWLGKYVRDWEERRGVRRRVKILAVAVVTLAVAAAWMTGEQSRVLQWAVTGFAALGLFVVWRLPVIDDKLPAQRAVSAIADSSSDLAA